jgi:DNA mismatch repair protein MutS
VLSEAAAGIAYLDITTSEFAATQLPLKRVSQELERLNPSEMVVPEGSEITHLGLEAPVTNLESCWFQEEVARDTILTQFQATALDGFGLANWQLATGAAGAILHYVQETQRGALGQINGLSAYSTGDFMALDDETQRNLGLLSGANGNREAALLNVIDLTRTAMGGRLLKQWLGKPLLDVGRLVKRQEAVGWFVADNMARNRVISLLGQLADLERLINRVRGGLANPRELVALRRSLELITELRDTIEASEPLMGLRDNLKPQPEIVNLITGAIEESPPASVSEGNVIRAGFYPDLDEIRLSSRNAKKYLADVELKERERTGIKSLKLGFNNVFGYYIEVSRANLGQVPAEYIRKQTLVGGERFFTPELKEYESLILHARDRIIEMETEVFRRVCRQVVDASESVMATAVAVAQLDVFAALAEVAVRYSYVRPQLNSGSKIAIKDGRHPVVERSLAAASFVANDTRLSNDDTQIMVLTGPNMAGKSTYLKQVALIVLLAQIGSFVPASEASIGLVDRIFTRIGARENLTAGQSTFMVEMVETANILHNATAKSLIILDEIGRGTSTYNGLSIARAASEYIHNRLGAKTIFATHYHEMVELGRRLLRVKNFNVAVAEEAGEVIFLRRVIPGGVDKSYGIHVARLAGLPRSVVHRAYEVLDELEGQSSPVDKGKRGQRHKKILPEQLSLTIGKSPLLEELAELDIESMTPLEALNRLHELKRKSAEY